MSAFHEQRICVKLRKSFAGTFEMLKITFGDEASTWTQTYEWWWKRFKEGRAPVDNDPRSGRSSASQNYENVKNVRKVIR